MKNSTKQFCKTNWLPLLYILFAFACFAAASYISEESYRKKPEGYQLQPATYYGSPAFTLLHEPKDGVQNISFFRAHNARRGDDPTSPQSKYWLRGRHIITVPTELAIEMYHEREGWPQ